MEETDQAVILTERRIRKLTEKGESGFQVKVQEFNNKLSVIRKQVDFSLQKLTSSLDIESLVGLREELTNLSKQYNNIFKSYAEYLTRVHTKESLNELSAVTLIHESVLSKVDMATCEIHTLIDKFPITEIKKETHTKLSSPTQQGIITTKAASQSGRSVKSVKSRHSSSHSTGSSSSRSVTQRLMGKLEAAKVRLKYITQEAELQKRLKILSSERSVKEVEAELGAMFDSFEEVGQDPDLDLSTESAHERTQAYVSEQALFLKEEKTQDPIFPTPRNTLNPRAPEFTPCPNINQSPITKSQQYVESKGHKPSTFPEISEFTKYIMKKDLMLSRLTLFNDKPERYFVWKTSFKNIVTDLDITPTEELDLLCRWLGPESSRQASSLRAANCANEAEAVHKIWERLDMRYGAPELVVQSFREQLGHFPKLTVKDTTKIYELADILAEMESLKADPRYTASLAYLDSSLGVNGIVNKLPVFIQSKWTDRALSYKHQNSVLYPPFTVFVRFIKDMAVRFNDPSFKFDTQLTSTTNPIQNRPQGTRSGDKSGPCNSNNHSLRNKPSLVCATKTEFSNSVGGVSKCPLHENSRHSLKDCRIFLAKSMLDKKELIQKHGICFKCCMGKHLAKDCKEDIKCQNCDSKDHCTLFHRPVKHGGELKPNKDRNDNVASKCTEICGSDSYAGKSCAKTLLLKIYPEGQQERALITYAVIDEQSNRSLAQPSFFEHFEHNSDPEEYVLSTCMGKVTKSGRRATGYTLESMDGTYKAACPTLIECDEIPDNRHEIPTPDIAKHYAHLKDIASFIPDQDPKAQISLLIGRDMIQVHHVLDQRIGPGNAPYAQKLRLGWVIIGETCLGRIHTTDSVNVHKTHVLGYARESVMKQCCNEFDVKEIFVRTPYDEEPGLSRQDKSFLTIMEKEFKQTDTGHWSAPLPFLQDRPRLPNNYSQAINRANSLAKSLKKNPIKLEHFIEFMGKILDNNHAEVAPPTTKGEEIWYLPIFGVYHPKKPSKIRVVFDSSARYQNISLNDVLITGPDLTNNLVGVLMKFRKEKIAVTADIEQMFFNFEVHESQRNFLRFIWFKDNDPSKEFIEYRMRVHVFGNSPSPSVATYGLRKSVCNHSDNMQCDDVCHYVKENFYVDDGLVSFQNEEDAVNLLMKTQQRLMDGGQIRLHKIASNNLKVINSFPRDDLAKDFTEIDFNSGTPNIQRSLGLSWNIIKDVFTYQISKEDRSYTKRGLLSVINSIFDPLGFVAPVTLGGRILMRTALQDEKLGWDDPLPEKVRSDWVQWKESLKGLESLEIPRAMATISVQESTLRELHVFSDASREAIGAVSYLRLYDIDGTSQMSFVLGKSKVAPVHGHTIPRLELCAALLATQLSDFVHRNLGTNIHSTFFYTDSQVVLGYINNDSRRFYMYVSNRVDKILKSSTRTQWHYVPTDQNPADQATRPVNANNIQNNLWLKGPLTFINSVVNQSPELYPLVGPEEDKEIRPHVNVSKSTVKECLGSNRFERFSVWTKLVSAIAYLKRVVFCRTSKQGTGNVSPQDKVEVFEQTERFILKEVQQEFYSKEIACLRTAKKLPKNSNIISLSPILDEHGLLRVGGRLSRTKLTTDEKTPVIVPGKHHIAVLLIRHFHGNIQHQGRHLTAGALRSAGYWVISANRLINSMLRKCVICQKMRGKVQHQKMSDLPADRVTPSPPFTYVGVDTFGPWYVTTRRTRGGAANSKRWAIMFSCLSSRAVHVEVVEELTSSSFINAFVDRGLLTPDELTKVKGTLENSDLVSKYGYGIPDASGRMPKMVLWRSPGSDVTGMVCRCEKVVTTSEKLLGGEVYHYSSKLMMKEPYIGGRQEWHQDYGYWYQNGLVFPDALSVFIAVDKCTKANGCLQILPASHKCGRIEHKFVSGQTGADVERVKEISKKLPLIYVEMNPGDGLFFHSNVLHQSDPNNSPDRRWALILAYNRASNNPIESLAPPFPRYTPLTKVPNSAILECTDETDFAGKEFLNPLDDKTVKAETQRAGNIKKV